MIDIIHQGWDDGIGSDTPRDHWTDHLIIKHLDDVRCPHVHAPMTEEPTCPTLLEYARIRRDSLTYRREVKA